MSEEEKQEEYFDEDIPAQINNLCSAYSTLIEVDEGLLQQYEGRRLRKARKRLIELIVDYVFLLPLSEEDKEED